MATYRDAFVHTGSESEYSEGPQVVWWFWVVVLAAVTTLAVVRSVVGWAGTGGPCLVRKTGERHYDGGVSSGVDRLPESPARTRGVPGVLDRDSVRSVVITVYPPSSGFVRPFIYIVGVTGTSPSRPGVTDVHRRPVRRTQGVVYGSALQSRSRAHLPVSGPTPPGDRSTEVRWRPSREPDPTSEVPDFEEYPPSSFSEVGRPGVKEEVSFTLPPYTE